MLTILWLVLRLSLLNAHHHNHHHNQIMIIIFVSFKLINLGISSETILISSESQRSFHLLFQIQFLTFSSFNFSRQFEMIFCSWNFDLSSTTFKINFVAIKVVKWWCLMTERWFKKMHYCTKRWKMMKMMIIIMMMMRHSYW